MPLPVLPQAFGTIDCLVSNAAVSPAAAPITQTPADAIDKVLDINIKAAVMLAQVRWWRWW